jgi:uncharacterized protein (DUF2252 family)
MKSLQERLTDFHLNRQQPTLPLKYKLMASNEFAFYRATCHLFYEDLSVSYVSLDGPLVWCCGDLHLENFGSYRANNGLVYFDINDFDEGMLAPATWDLVRFLTSIGMAAGLWRYSTKEAENLMLVVLKAYSQQLVQGKAYAIERETSPQLIQEFFRMAEKQREKELIKARVDRKKEKLKIIKNKTLPLDGETYKFLKQEVSNFLKEQYGFFKIKDIAFRIAGTGSLGVKRYVILVEDKRQNKLRLLDMKQALPSSLAPFVKSPQPHWSSEAERIISIQSMMQYALPRFMKSLSVGEEKFVLKQMQPSAQKIDHSLCHRKLENTETIMTTMAQALASAQIRSASRKGSVDVETLIDFSTHPLWQTELIHTSLELVHKMKNYFLEFQKISNK